MSSYLKPVFAECAFTFNTQDYEKSGLDVLFFGQEHYDTMAILTKDVDHNQYSQLIERQQLLKNKELLQKNFKEVVDNLRDCESYIQQILVSPMITSGFKTR